MLDFNTVVIMTILFGLYQLYNFIKNFSIERIKLHPLVYKSKSGKKLIIKTIINNLPTMYIVDISKGTRLLEHNVYVNEYVVNRDIKFTKLTSLDDLYLDKIELVNVNDDIVSIITNDKNLSELNNLIN